MARSIAGFDSMQQSLASLNLLCIEISDLEGLVGIYAKPMQVNTWIKAARQAMGKTQSEFGDLLGVGKANVSHWEHGTHQASYVQILKIAAASGRALPMIDGVNLPPADVSPKAWDLALSLDAIKDEQRRNAAYAMCLNSIEVLAQLERVETAALPATPRPYALQS